MLLNPESFSGAPLDARIVGVAVMRDEAARLPRWLAHYRGMGVDHFVIVDNGSKDGTAELLRSQPDVTALTTGDSFAAANYGMDWVNALRRSLSPDVWTLFADADEYLVHASWPNVRLPDYLASLPGRTSAVTGFMLDMYPRDHFESAAPGSDLFKTCGWHDSRYRFRTRPRKPWEPGPGGGVEVLGGPRTRLLSSFQKQQKTTWVDYFLRGQLDRLLPVTPSAWQAALVSTFPRTMPSLKKTPLLRGHAVTYMNNHDTDGGCLSGRNCVLLHFKFTSDFLRKVADVDLTRQHYRAGAEYAMYKGAFQRSGTSLYMAGESVRFESASELARLGLIRDISQFEGVQGERHARDHRR